MVKSMIYILDGVEIQYRECQILRETAGNVLRGKNEAGSPAQYKEEWIAQLERLAESSESKRRYAVPLSKTLAMLPEDIFEAVSEYAAFLVKKGRGIDIMVPFTAANLRTILPVNTHEGMGAVYEDEGKDGMN